MASHKSLSPSGKQRPSCNGLRTHRLLCVQDHSCTGHAVDVRIHQTTKWTANGNHLQFVPLIRCGLRTTQGRFSHPAESPRPDNNNELETIGLIYSHSTGEQGAVFRATAALRPPPHRTRTPRRPGCVAGQGSTMGPNGMEAASLHDEAGCMDGARFHDGVGPQGWCQAPRQGQTAWTAPDFTTKPNGMDRAGCTPGRGARLS